MDWFKRKTPSGGVVSTPPKSHSPPPNVTVPDASAAGVPAEPTAEQRLHVLEMERKESEGEYLRRLESLAQVVSEKSEESEQLMEKLRQQEEDMKALIDKLVGQEKELETYKENQTEYKRRLEVLTDCLEDLARENMKLAAKGVPASMPEDYEEERMPTRQEVQIQKTKSEVAAETAAKSVPNKTASRNMPTDTHTQYNAAPTKAITETPPPIVKPSPRTKPESTETHALIHTSSSAPTSPTTTHANEAKEAHPDANKEISRRNTPSPTGGLVLPSKSKSKGELRDTPAIKSLTDSAGTALLKGADTPPISATPPSTSAPSKHKRAPSNENDFSSMAGDPKALMVVLKKYKAQADSLRRDLIREKQKSESLQLSIDQYEERAVQNDKTYRDNLLKESKRRKDAEYIANVLKKRVTELQFLLDEKDDSDHDSEDEDDKAKDHDGEAEEDD